MNTLSLRSRSVKARRNGAKAGKSALGRLVSANSNSKAANAAPAPAKPVRSKYGVRIDAEGKAARTIDGTLFASLKEAKRYVVLKQLQRTGEIEQLKLQPKFVLHAPRGIRVRIGTYVADFSYFKRDKWGAFSIEIIEDVKGHQTALFRWKKKHAEAEHGIKVTLV